MNLIPEEETESIRARLIENTEPEPYTGCWIWTAGYFGHKEPFHRRPAICIQGKNKFAYRISFEAFVGKIPAGLHVMHKCDNPACIRPSHLRLGTDAENKADKVSKNRQSKGSNSSISKLVESDILEIRAMRSAGRLYREIAAKYGVAYSTIYQIIQGNAWKHA